MSPNRRNVLVGITVLVGLLFLAWMMAEFGSKLALPFTPRMMPVHFTVDRADGLSDGSGITYRGVTVGRVRKLTRAGDQLHVLIEADVEAEPPLPANVQGVIRSTGLLSAASTIVLEWTGNAPSGQLKAEQEIPSKFVGLDLLPPELTELAGELRGTIKQFRESNITAHVDQQVQKVGELIDSIHGIVADEKLRDDLRGSLANIRETTERAKTIAGKFDSIGERIDQLSVQTTTAVNDISKQTAERMAEISKLLGNIQAITDKVNNGQGTAGQLVNDPKLYQSLVDTSRELNATVTDMKRLVEQWEQEGVSLKLK